MTTVRIVLSGFEVDSMQILLSGYELDSMQIATQDCDCFSMNKKDKQKTKTKMVSEMLVMEAPCFVTRFMLQD